MTPELALDFPLLKENIWQISPDEPLSFVETPRGLFEVPTTQALAFLRIRSHCTPHNTVAAIAARSGTPQPEVAAMLEALGGIGLLAGADEPPATGVPAIRARLQRIIALWSEELGRTFIGNSLLDGNTSKTILIGWLLETYHYVRDFPEAIAAGAARAPAGPLKSVLQRYAEEERGHEGFVLAALENIGVSRPEVRGSRPLVSTRLIGLLMRELFTLHPASVLLMAALVEAQELDGGRVDEFQARLETTFDLPRAALAPYFEHQALDARLGHCRLFADNLDCFDITEPDLLDELTDKLHDLKHAFDLQGLEIRQYYGVLDGKYLPRQPMPFAAV